MLLCSCQRIKCSQVFSFICFRALFSWIQPVFPRLQFAYHINYFFKKATINVPDRQSIRIIQRGHNIRNTMQPVDGTINWGAFCLSIPRARHKEFDENQAGKKSSNMCRICNSPGVRSAQHSESAYYLKNDPNANGPKGGNMSNKTDEEHGHSSARK